MKRVILALLAVLVAAPVLAQQPRISGSITAGGVDCSVAARCVALQVGAAGGSARIDASGFGSATITVETSIDATSVTTGTWTVQPETYNLATGATGSTFAASGSYVVPLKAGQWVRARASAYSSGTIAILLGASAAPVSFAPLTTQPISGTVTANAGSGSFTVAQATASNLKVDLSGTAANATAIKVDGSAVTQPVSFTMPSLVAGAALVGKVGLDQTTPGTTNAVSLAQIGATTVVTGGVSGLLAVGGNVANAGAATANPVPVGGVFTTSPTTLTTGQTATAQFTAAQRLVVDGSQVTQPISAASLPLPALAATSTKQSDGSQKTQIVDGSGNVIASTSNNLNVQCANCSGSGVSAADEATFTAGTSLFASAGGFFQTTATNNALTTGQQGAFQVTANRALFSNLRNAAGTEMGTSSNPLQITLANTGANATAVKVDGSAVTQPVSGTVTANIGTTNGLALDASVTGLQVAQGSTTSGQKGELIQGAVTTASPSYTTGQTSPLSLDVTGGLRVNCVVGCSGTTLGQTIKANSLPVTLATDQGPIAVNAYQLNGWPIPSGVGLSTPGTQRVALSRDSRVLVEPGASALTANVQAVATTAAPTYTNQTPAPLSLDLSGALRVNVTSGSTGNAAAGATGSAVPAQGDYLGLNVAGTLRGQTGVNPSGAIFAAQVDLASVAGATIAQGHGTAATAIRVELPTDGTGVVGLAAGSAVIGHVIADSGSTTAVTGNVTVVQGTGTNLHAVIDTGSTTAVTQATAANLNAQVVGNIASGGADSGNPLKDGGVFNTTQPTVTNGQRVDAQYTARGGAIVSTGVDTFNVTVNAALPAGGNTIGAVTQASGPWTNNVTQFGSTNVSTGTGAGGAGIPRVTISNDSSLAANQSVNVNQFGGSAVVTGTGTGGAGIPRVTVSSDSTVTANAGTNLNTSALALDATLTGRLPAGGSPANGESNTNTNLSRIGGYNFIYNGSTWDRWTGAVTQGGAPWSENLTQFGGTSVTIGKQLAAASIPVVHASDDPVVVALSQLSNALRTSTSGKAGFLGSFGRPVTSTGDALDVNVKYAPASFDPCLGPTKDSVAISQTASAKLLSGNGRKYVVCQLKVVGADAENVSLVEGTGAACGTGTAAIDGGTTAANGPNFAANGGAVDGTGGAGVLYQHVAGNDICLLQSGSGRVAGHLTFAFAN